MRVDAEEELEVVGLGEDLEKVGGDEYRPNGREGRGVVNSV